jgi:hypothetical protein
MKRIALFFVAFLVACGLNLLVTPTATARPEYKTQLEEITKDSKFAETYKELTQKCNVCHYGKTKKNRNDFGKAVNATMNEDVYKSMKEDKEKLKKKIDEALRSALKAKSPSGKTFGQLMEAGELPAKNPEE